MVEKLGQLARETLLWKHASASVGSDAQEHLSRRGPRPPEKVADARRDSPEPAFRKEYSSHAAFLCGDHHRHLLLALFRPDRTLTNGKNQPRITRISRIDGKQKVHYPHSYPIREIRVIRGPQLFKVSSTFMAAL